MSIGESLTEAGGGLISSLIGAGSARAQMAFQERMRATQHQTEVEDLKKAGLNPVLSAQGGAGTPTGAMYQPENPLKGFAANQTNSKLANAQIEKTAAETENLRAQAEVTRAQLMDIDSRVGVNSAQRQKTLSELPVAGKTIENLDSMIKTAESQRGVNSAQRSKILLESLGLQSDLSRKKVIQRLFDSGTSLLDAISQWPDILDSKKSAEQIYDKVDRDLRYIPNNPNYWRLIK